MWREFARLRVPGCPATFATAHEAAWKAAVRDAVRQAALPPVQKARFRVAIISLTATPKRPDERWDIDNLELVATKSAASDEKPAGAEIAIWIAPGRLEAEANGERTDFGKFLAHYAVALSRGL